MREVVDEPLSKRVGDHDEDGRDRVVRTPQRGNRRAALHDQHVRAKRNHFCGVAFIELGVAARPAPIDVYVLDPRSSPARLDPAAISPQAIARANRWRRNPRAHRGGACRRPAAPAPQTAMRPRQRQGQKIFVASSSPRDRISHRKSDAAYDSANEFIAKSIAVRLNAPGGRMRKMDRQHKAARSRDLAEKAPARPRRFVGVPVEDR